MIKGNCWYRCKNCSDDCKRLPKMKFLIENCGITNPEKYTIELFPQYVEIESYKQLQETKDNIINFIDNGENMYIYSDSVATGKTTWSVKMMLKFFDEIWADTGYYTRGYFIYVPDFITKSTLYAYRETEEFLQIDNIIRNADLIIWDNISNSILNTQERKILESYIGNRLNSKKSNIYNGLCNNHTKDYVGDIISSYLHNSKVVELKGTSRIINNRTKGVD